MRRRAYRIWLPAILGMLLSSCVQVAGDEVGVRVVNLWKGVEKSAKKTGTYLYLPGIYDFYLFPKTQQKLEMVETQIPAGAPAAKEAPKAAAAEQAYEVDLSRIDEQMRKIQQAQVVPHKLAEGRENIRLKTADGNDIWVDVTVSYQVIEDLAPVLVQKVGTSMEAVNRLVGMETRGTARQVLGELSTKDFYNEQAEAQGEQREMKLLETFKLLNAKLNPLGIRITSLTVNQFRFVPDYEDLLRERAVYDQKRKEFEQLILAAENENKAKVAKAIGDANAMRTLAEGRKQSLNLEGEGEQVKLTMEAQGLRELTRGLAGPGGDNLLARELGRTLEGKKIILVPSEGTINLLNVNDLVKNYGALQLLEEQAGAEAKKPEGKGK